MKKTNLLGLALAAVSLPAITFAQADTAQLTGTVKDSSGATVPSATVTIKNTATGLTRTLTTHSDGTYTFTSLPVGTYSESVTAQGFATYTTQVTLQVGGFATVVPVLTAGEVTTTIEVTGGNEASTVNTTNAEISQVITPQQISQLPSLTRDPYDFVALSGSVSSDPGGSTVRGVGVSFGGTRAAGTEVLLDGVENADNYGAAVGVRIPLDAVQEYRVITNGLDAQYGRASGGVVNLITKSGTNKFHGSLYEYNRVSALAANTYYEDAYNAAARASGAAQLPADHFTRNQFGYSVGGPIFKDRLFFFSNTEWQRIRSAGSQTFLVPSAAFLAASSAATRSFFSAYGTLAASTIQGPTVAVAGYTGANPLQRVTVQAPLNAGAGDPQNTWFGAHRLDYTVNNRINMYFRAGVYKDQFFPGYVSLSPYAGFNTSDNDFNQTYLYSLNYIITPSLISNSKVNFSRVNTNEPLNSNTPTPTLYLNQANTASTFSGIPIAMPGYLPTTPGNAVPFGGPANTYQFDQQFLYNKGKHSFEFGGAFLQIRDNRTFGAYFTAVEQVARTGTATATALAALQNGSLYSFQVALNPQGKLPCSYNGNGTLNVTTACSINLPASSPNFERQNTFNDGSFYVQDQWKVSPRFTMTYGLRWDYYGVQHNHNANLESNFFLGTGNTLADQVASGQVATTPNSPVGGLIKKDLNNFAPRIGFAVDPFGDGKWSVRGGFGMSYERNFGNVTYNVIQNPPAYAGVQLVTSPTRPLTISTANLGPFAGTSGTVGLVPPSLRALQQNMPTAYTELFGLSVERQLSPNDIIEVQYNGTNGVHQYAIANVNGIGYGSYTGGDINSANANYNLNRLNHQYGAINIREANGSSHYSGLNVRFNDTNMSRLGLTLTVNYTYAHALDNLSSTFSESGNNFNLGYLNPYQPRLDYGNADSDTRHRVTIGGVYQPKFLEFRENKVAHTILGGLEFAPIATLRTGTPFTIYDCTNGENACPRIVKAAGLQYHGTTGALTDGINSFNYLDIPAASANPFVNAQGFSDFANTVFGLQNSGLGRNQWFGPANVSFDAGVYKNFAFGERIRVQLRGEFYNVLNHHNYYPVLSTADIAEVSNVNVQKGGSGSSSDERRNTQLAIRLEF